VNRKIYGIVPLAAVLLALAVAGCGGSSSSSSESSSGSETASAAGGESEKAPVKAAPNAEEGTTFVSLGNAGALGMVLVDSKGMTLYEFQKDQGEESACNGECAKAWPPLLTEGEPQPSNGASASKLGTIEREDGTTQVTYAGRPLYGFVGDKGPGEANGNDVTAFGAQWYALTGEGEEASESDGGGTTTGGTTTSGGDGSGGATTSEDSGTTTSGGGGYGY
jgi:predicted lipoprotein with Yx(FWY)xxD motif